MADNICGGSTPMKTLTDWGSNDRSLQQDRHLGAGPNSSFRTGGQASQPDADRLYAGFANGLGPSPAQPVPQHGLESLTPGRIISRSSSSIAQGSHILPASHYQVNGRPPLAAGVASPQSWARDFAAFNEASQTGVISPMSGRGNLHPPFMTAHQVFHVPAMSHPHIAQHPFFVGSAGPAPFAPVHGETGSGTAATTAGKASAQEVMTAEVDFDNAMAQWMAINGHGEDVDGILEEMAQELEEGQRAGLPELQPTRAPTGEMDSPASALDLPAQANYLPRPVSVGATSYDTQLEGGPSDEATLPNVNNLHLDDTRRQSIATDNMTDSGTTSEVSEAARQLLQTVQHERGEKWQNSRFLHLMREFRDGSKSIVNEEIRESGDVGPGTAGSPV